MRKVGVFREKREPTRDPYLTLNIQVVRTRDRQAFQTNVLVQGAAMHYALGGNNTFHCVVRTFIDEFTRFFVNSPAFSSLFLPESYVRLLLVHVHTYVYNNATFLIGLNYDAKESRPEFL